jgi:hypothetical protein
MCKAVKQNKLFWSRFCEFAPRKFNMVDNFNQMSFTEADVAAFAF